MATKPTDRILNWASAGGASDPGIAKGASGFFTGERLVQTYVDWIYAAYGDWIRYLDSALLPLHISQEMQNNGLSPFGGDIKSGGVRIHWDHIQDKFYANVHTDITFDKIAFESTDGLTWSGNTTYNLNDATSIPTPRIAYCPDTDRIGTASESFFHLSSSNSVTGLSQTPTDTFPQITNAVDVIWDDTNNLWIVAGNYSSDTNGAIETDTSGGTTFTNRLTLGSPCTSMANNRAGTTVAVFGGAGNMYRSTNGTTWTRQTNQLGVTFQDIRYLPFANLFVADDRTNDTMYWSEDGAVWTDTGWGDVSFRMIVTDRFCIFTSDFGATGESFLIDSADGVKGYSPPISLGFNLAPDLINSTAAGSSSAFAYYNINNQLVHCVF